MWGCERGSGKLRASSVGTSEPGQEQKGGSGKRSRTLGTARLGPLRACPVQPTEWLVLPVAHRVSPALKGSSCRGAGGWELGPSCWVDEGSPHPGLHGRSRGRETPDRAGAPRAGFRDGDHRLCLGEAPRSPRSPRWAPPGTGRSPGWPEVIVSPARLRELRPGSRRDPLLGAGGEGFSRSPHAGQGCRGLTHSSS